MGQSVKPKPPHIEIAENRIAQLQEQGLLSFNEIGAFAQIFDELSAPKPPVPEEIMIEADLKPQSIGGVQMIGQDSEKAEIRQAMQDIGAELTNYLLRERFINFVRYAPPGQKPRLRGLLLAYRPPAPKKEPFVKPKVN